MLKFLFYILQFIVTDRICGIISAIYCGKKCNYNCENCGMWSCTYGTEYPDYKIPPYDDYSNVCGKFRKGGKYEK